MAARLWCGAWLGLGLLAAREGFALPDASLGEEEECPTCQGEADVKQDGAEDADGAINMLQRRGQKVARGTDVAADMSNGTVLGSDVPYGHPSPSKAYPAVSGFKLWLVEEFDSPLDLDHDEFWTWSDGGLIEGNIRFVKEGIKFQNGLMMLEASNTLKVQTQACSNAEVATITPKKLTSGEIRTKHNMFRYGRYEARMKAPSVQPGNPGPNGNYISTLFVFRDAKYKHWREIDFEITGDGPGAVTTNVLSADNTDKWKAGIQESEHHQMSFNTRADFHIYAFEWLPDRITWYVDGRKVREKHSTRVPVPDLPGKVIMNLWVFGDRASFGGSDIRNNRYPMHSEYDWFRFYKWEGEKRYPCEGGTTDCLTSDDQYLSSNNPCDGIPQVGTVYGKAPCKSTCLA